MLISTCIDGELACPCSAAKVVVCRLFQGLCACALLVGFVVQANGADKTLRKRWDALKIQTEALFQQHKYEEALTSSQEMLRIAEQMDAPGDFIGYACAMSGYALRDLKRYSEAEPYLVRALAAYQTTVKEDNPNIVNVLTALAQLYGEESKLSEEERTRLQLIPILEKKHGENSYEVADARYWLAWTYLSEGRIRESGELFEASLAQLEKHFGKDSPEVAGRISVVAGSLVTQERNIEAEALLRRSISIFEALRGKIDRSDPSGLRDWTNDSIMEMRNLGTLGRVLIDEGKYREADHLFQQALQVAAEAFKGEEFEDYASEIMHDLALLYLATGRFDDAEKMEQRALKAWARGGPNARYITAYGLAVLSSIDFSRQHYSESLSHAQEALDMIRQVLPPDHEEIALFLNNLAEANFPLGNFAESERLLRSSLSILEKQWGPEHPKLLLQLGNLTGCLLQTGRYAEAESVILRAAAIEQRQRSPQPFELIQVLSNLADVYWVEDRPEKAKPQLIELQSLLENQIQDVLPYGSERDRLEFLATTAKQAAHFYSFVDRFQKRDPELVGEMYDQILRQKGIVAAGLSNALRLIQQQRDPGVSEMLKQLGVKRSQLAALADSKMQSKERDAEAESLAEETRNLERQIAERSAALLKPAAPRSWRDIQTILKPSDAAIEFIRFETYNGVKWTGNAQYAALVLRHGGEPVLVNLGDAKRLESSVSQHSPTTATRGVSVTASVDLYDFWSALQPHLEGVNRLFLSPDGILQEFSFDAMKTRDGRYLLQEYEIRVVSSTRDLLERPRSATNRSAVLFGNPAFDLSDEQWNAARANAFGLQNLETSRDAADSKNTAQLPAVAAEGNLRSTDAEHPGALQSLPGTAIELENVARLLHAHGWDVETHTGSQALEEIVKRVQRPAVLHLATHGFFLQDRTVRQLGQSVILADDPMVRTGLFFAGANSALAGQALPEGDDGILTALEASDLDLQGTELVVLSACGTGLGSIENGEGVFGLRRALQLAGAQSILMSLWSVPDRETTELMSLFYSKWLDGEPKHQALHEAELEMRQRVIDRYGADLPFYWGAFVLVGEN